MKLAEQLKDPHITAACQVGNSRVEIADNYSCAATQLDIDQRLRNIKKIYLRAKYSSLSGDSPPSSFR